MQPLDMTWIVHGRAALCAAFLTVLSSLAVARAEASSAAPGPRRVPEARVLASQGWKSPMSWLGGTRVGLLHIVVTDTLFTFDLLDGARRLGRPVHVPAAWGGLQPLPVPASNVVVVPRARSGACAGTAPPGGVRPPGRTAGDTLSSYGIDAFTGTVLWERAPLPRKMALVHLPDAGALLECRGDEPRARVLDLATGETLWETTAEAWQVRPRAGYVEVIGETGRLLDARTGQVVLGYRLPVARSQDIARLWSPDRVVVREEGAIVGYRLPPLPAGAADTVGAPAPRETVLAPEWKLELPWALEPGCLEGARVPLPRDLLVVRSRGRSHLLDGVSGRLLWQGGDEKTQFAVSPDLRSVAALAGSRLVLVDVESGVAQVQSLAQACSGAGGKVRTLLWLDDDQVLLCCAEKGDRMTGMSVFSRSRGATLWQSGATFPQPQFALTSGEKVVGVLKFAMTVTAIVAPFVQAYGMLSSVSTIPELLAGAGALSAAPSIALTRLMEVSLLIQMIGTRASIPLRDQVVLWPFGDTQIGLATPVTGPPSGDPMAAVAWRRYQATADSAMAARPGTKCGIAGAENRYDIVEQDYRAPAQRTLSVFRHKAVHGMGLLTPYRMAVTVEDDEHAASIVWFGDGEPPPVPPELRAPGAEGPQDARPR